MEELKPNLLKLKYICKSQNWGDCVYYVPKKGERTRCKYADNYPDCESAVARVNGLTVEKKKYLNKEKNEKKN